VIFLLAEADKNITVRLLGLRSSCSMGVYSYPISYYFSIFFYVGYLVPFFIFPVPFPNLFGDEWHRIFLTFTEIITEILHGRLFSCLVAKAFSRGALLPHSCYF